ncbi:hypothetical protein TGVAND_436460 [Toxoplasma gondii VAND]|uniref:Uncharacterized protein n=1 Tax=Toxoplasma gondii VAND TaxID=933077 RepID=A0A086Q660_TOXGO|nr:hypothetical protein TGVAND_436460 [Toxoplasma gondii VAND]
MPYFITAAFSTSSSLFFQTPPLTKILTMVSTFAEKQRVLLHSQTDDDDTAVTSTPRQSARDRVEKLVGFSRELHQRRGPYAPRSFSKQQRKRKALCSGDERRELRGAQLSSLCYPPGGSERAAPCHRAERCFEKKAAERRERSRLEKRGRKEKGETKKEDRRARKRWAERRLSRHDGDGEAPAR